MDYPQIRRTALEALKRNPATDWRNFCYLCARVAHELGFLEPQGALSTSDAYHVDRLIEALGRGNRERIREVFWALLIEGVIILGRDDANPTWPHFRVTEYGRKVLEAGEVIPHDLDGYLERVRTECAPFDPIVEVYLQEALQCFLRATYIASSVMLGIASERLFLKLLYAYKDSLDPAAKTRLEQAIANRPIGRQWEKFMKILDSQESGLPSELQEDLDAHLNGIFTLVRATLNESEHPRGIRMDREIMFAHLQLFRPYAKRMVALTNYFASKARQP